MTIKRRDFLACAGSVLAASTARSASSEDAASANSMSGNDRPSDPTSPQSPSPSLNCTHTHIFNEAYEKEFLGRVAFPLGGMGAGSICLEGTGTLSKFSLWNRPNLLISPTVFAALSIKGPFKASRVLEGPLPGWKLFPDYTPGIYNFRQEIPPNMSLGFPRFRGARFSARFPFATVQLEDDRFPLDIELTGWSPISPNDADNASLPVAAVEYTVRNSSAHEVKSIFSFNSMNFMAADAQRVLPSPAGPVSADRIDSIKGGFLLYGMGAGDKKWDEGRCAIWIDDPAVEVNHLWFRDTDIFSTMQMAWNDIREGRCYTRPAAEGTPSPGATIFVPFALGPNERKTIRVKIAWYVPNSNVYSSWSFQDDGSLTANETGETYKPWYSTRFRDIWALIEYWSDSYDDLRTSSALFSETFYDSTLPPEVIEAVAANLTILKAPNILRQVDGRIWGWEGSGENVGTGGPGTPPHVFGMGQAMPHLFSALERGIRETEFGPDQNREGRQSDRAALPIRPLREDELQLYDATYQCLGVILFFRDWRISGDTEWLRRWWPRIDAAMSYAIDQLDPMRRGRMGDNPMNAGDGENWGGDSWRMSCYVDALNAAIVMGRSLGQLVRDWAAILEKAKEFIESTQFNGEYFEQYLDTKNAIEMIRKSSAKSLVAGGGNIHSPEALELMERDGPFGQTGKGCSSMGMLGTWLSWTGGLKSALDARKVASHLAAAARHNFKADLGDFPCNGRYFMASREESGLLMCTWPKGDTPTLPHSYGSEVWTGVEYMVASHLISTGVVADGLKIVAACRRRYDGRIRNPFDEVEAGHWYARAMSSYALLQSFSGARFDAVEKVMYLKPVIKGDFRSFISTATGYGTVGVKNGKPFVEVVFGDIPYTRIKYTGT